jgi:Right handed beta helix region
VGGGRGAGNQIRGNGTGLLVRSSTDLTVSFNRITLNRRWGIDIQAGPTRVNVVHNVVTNNWQGPPEESEPTIDCRDGTLIPPGRSENTWTDNIGGSSFPAGICTPAA